MENTVKTSLDKLCRVTESFTVNRYDNGFMVEVTGTNHQENYHTVKINVSTVQQLTEIIQQIVLMDLND